MHVEGYNTSSTNGYICLWYVDNPISHYEWLKGHMPEGTQNGVCAGPLQGGRGGATAHSEAASASGCTRQSALPSASSSARKTWRSALPQTIRKDSRGTATPSASWCTAQSETQAASSAASSGSRKRNRDIDYEAFIAANAAPPKIGLKPQASAKEWTCPECKFSTGCSKRWLEIRRNHIAKWHPELKNKYSLKRIPDFVPWNPELCSWKCPLCGDGMPKHITGMDAKRHARIAHAERKHPEADKRLFSLKGSKAQQGNCRKATVAKTSAGIAKKLLDLKTGEQGDHDCTILRMPCTGTAKKHRKFINVLMCKKCKSIAKSAQHIGRIRCDSHRVAGPKRKQLLQRLRTFAETCSEASQERADTLTFLRRLEEPSEPRLVDHGPHEVILIHTPTTPSRKMFFCKKCRRVSCRRYIINQKHCGKTEWSPARQRLILQIDQALKRARGTKHTKLSETKAMLTGKATGSSQP